MRPTDSARPLPRILIAILLLLLVGRAVTKGRPQEPESISGGLHTSTRSSASGPRVTTSSDLMPWSPIEGAPSIARSRRLPLLYEYSAEWCGPCKRVESEVWNDAAAIGELSQLFVPVHVVDRRQEEGQNPAIIDSLQEAHGIQAFPTFIVTTIDGRPVGRVEGYGNKARLLDSLRVFAARAGSS